MRARRGAQRQSAQPAARRGDAALRVERVEFAQQRPRLLERRPGRRVEEGERRRIGHAPGGAIEKERAQVGGQDLGPRKGFERPGRGLLPEAIAHARLRAARAPAALVGGGARDAHCFEPREPEIGLVDRHAGEAGIDDDPHAFDGERGLGDRGGEHHLAAAWPCGARRPGPAPPGRARRRAARCRRQGRPPARAAGSRRGGSRPVRAGRRGREPGSARRARVTASATSSSMRRSGSRPRWRVSTG